MGNTRGTVITTESKVVEVNGLRLHYVERRPGHLDPDNGLLALLLHGSSGNACVWDLFAQVLARHMPTVALDLRGHGLSDRAMPPAYQGSDYIADLDQIINKLEVSRAILVAHSMSVFHSIGYCANNPDRVAKLVLIDIEARCRTEHRDLLRVAGLKPHPIFASLDEAIARERRSAPFASAEALTNFVESNLTAVETEGHTQRSLTYRFDRATLAQFDDYDEWSNLRRIRCPALLVYGKESQLVRPEVMHAMKEELIAGDLATVPRAGHLPMLDNPDGFANAVLGFCTNGSV